MPTLSPTWQPTSTGSALDINSYFTVANILIAVSAIVGFYILCVIAYIFCCFCRPITEPIEEKYNKTRNTAPDFESAQIDLESGLEPTHAAKVISQDDRGSKSRPSTTSASSAKNSPNCQNRGRKWSQDKSMQELDDALPYGVSGSSFLGEGTFASDDNSPASIHHKTVSTQLNHEQKHKAAVSVVVQIRQNLVTYMNECETSADPTSSSNETKTNVSPRRDKSCTPTASADFQTSERDVDRQEKRTSFITKMIDTPILDWLRTVSSFDSQMNEQASLRTQPRPSIFYTAHPLCDSSSSDVNESSRKYLHESTMYGDRWSINPRTLARTPDGPSKTLVINNARSVRRSIDDSFYMPNFAHNVSSTFNDQLESKNSNGFTIQKCPQAQRWAYPKLSEERNLQSAALDAKEAHCGLESSTSIGVKVLR